MGAFFFQLVYDFCKKYIYTYVTTIIGIIILFMAFTFIKYVQGNEWDHKTEILSRLMCVFQLPQIHFLAAIRFDILNKNRWVYFSVIYFGSFLLVYYLPQHDSISAPILDWTFQLPSKYHRKQHGLHFFESLPKNHSRSSMRL